jgi:hypothetical protein
MDDIHVLYAYGPGPHTCAFATSRPRSGGASIRWLETEGMMLLFPTVSITRTAKGTEKENTYRLGLESFKMSEEARSADWSSTVGPKLAR